MGKKREFVWSISRDNILNNCERKYFFQYLVPAKIDSKRKKLREIAFLNKLTSIPMWKGKVFHTIIAKFLQNDCKTDLNKLSEWYINRMKEQWDRSVNFSVNEHDLDKSIAFIQKNKIFLIEHFYKRENIEISLDPIISEIEALIEQFNSWNSELEFLDMFNNCPNKWIEPPYQGRNSINFDYNGTKIIIRYDLALENSDGDFLIYDWKTSKPIISRHYLTNAEIQSGVYQLYPFLKLRKSLENIHSYFIHFNSDSYEMYHYKINKNFKEIILNLIRRSISRMKFFNQVHYDQLQKTLLDLPSLKLNDLDYAINDWSCRYCQFKKLCQEDI